MTHHDSTPAWIKPMFLPCPGEEFYLPACRKTPFRVSYGTFAPPEFHVLRQGFDCGAPMLSQLDVGQRIFEVWCDDHVIGLCHIEGGRYVNIDTRKALFVVQIQRSLFRPEAEQVGIPCYAAKGIAQHIENVIHRCLTDPYVRHVDLLIKGVFSDLNERAFVEGINDSLRFGGIFTHTDEWAKSLDIQFHLEKRGAYVATPGQRRFT